MRFKYYGPLLAAAILGLVVGAVGMYDRLANGLNPTHLGSYIPWGLWVAFYLFFLGLSAGAFLVNILVYVLNLKTFERIGRLSAFMVLIALVCEVQFILLDLGWLSRGLYQFFLTPSFSSLMTWMFVLFLAMLLLYLFKTHALLRADLVRLANDPASGAMRGIYGLLAFGKTQYGPEDAVRDDRRVHFLARISLPVGLLFYGTNGAFFAVLLSRPIWNSALTPLLFIVAALLSGGALIAFLIYVFRQPDPTNPSGQCSSDEICLKLGRIILFLLVAFLGLEAMLFSVGYQSGKETVVASLNIIVGGRDWWVFWIVHILVGSLIPLLLLTFGGDSPRSVTWACLLIFATFLAVRWNFVLPDLAVYKLEGLDKAFSDPRLRTFYTPSLNEWLVSLWSVSVGMLLFVLGIRYLPVITENGGDTHAR